MLGRNQSPSSTNIFGYVIAFVVLTFVGVVLLQMQKQCSAPSKSEMQLQPQPQATVPHLCPVEWPESDFKGLLHTIAVEGLSADINYSLQESTP